MGKKHYHIDLLKADEEKILADQDKKRLTKRILSHSSDLIVPQSKSKHEIWVSIESRLSHGKVVDISWRKWNIARIAASLIAICLVGALLYFQDTTIVALNGEHVITYLPDSSQVTLNAGSEISYNASMWWWKRNVSLSGEAFFKVQKGSTFKVKTAHGEVAVLGTSFNVYDRQDVYKVDCFTGKVKVGISNNVVVLLPGEFTSLTQNA